MGRIKTTAAMRQMAFDKACAGTATPADVALVRGLAAARSHRNPLEAVTALEGIAAAHGLDPAAAELVTIRKVR